MVIFVDKFSGFVEVVVRNLVKLWTLICVAIVRFVVLSCRKLAGEDRVVQYMSTYILKVFIVHFGSLSAKLLSFPPFNHKSLLSTIIKALKGPSTSIFHFTCSFCSELYIKWSTAIYHYIFISIIFLTFFLISTVFFFVFFTFFI